MFRSFLQRPRGRGQNRCLQILVTNLRKTRFGIIPRVCAFVCVIGLTGCSDGLTEGGVDGVVSKGCVSDTNSEGAANCFARGGGDHQIESESADSTSDTNASTVTASYPTCYGTYVGNYRDLTLAYKLRSDQSMSIERWGYDHFNAYGKNEGRQLPSNCSSTNPQTTTSSGTTTAGNTSYHACYGTYVGNYRDLTLAYKLRSDQSMSIERWGYDHYNAYGKNEGRRLPSSCPGVSSNPSQCRAGGTSAGSLVGPDLNGSDWKGVFESYRGARSAISASVTHNGSRVVITTSKPSGVGRQLVGRIKGDGNLTLCDRYDQETWTTIHGAASRTVIKVSDYVMRGPLRMGTNVISLSR